MWVIRTAEIHGIERGHGVKTLRCPKCETQAVGQVNVYSFVNSVCRWVEVRLYSSALVGACGCGVA